MKDSPSVSSVSLSAVGLDNSFKRSASATKTTPERKLQPRSSGGSGMNRSSSSGSLVPTRSASARRRSLLLAAFVAVLVLVSTFLLKDLKLFAATPDPGDLAVSRSEDGTGYPAPAKTEEQPRVGAQEQAPVSGVGSADSGTQAEPATQADGSKRHKKGRRKRRGQRGKDRKEKGKGRHERKVDASMINPLDPELPSSHPCSNFSLPPPPSDPKRTGPRACPVCYLPLKEALAVRPQRDREAARPVLKELTFVSEADKGEQAAIRAGEKPKFAGHQTLAERAESFQLAEKMHVHCGFVWGGEPGAGTGFDSSPEDRAYMHSCRDVVVASAIFGAYDLVQQPSEIGELAKENVCFVMFVDEVTHESLLKDGTLKDKQDRRVGLWRLVVVTNIPYTDPRRTGKIPKLLAHRLFPNAQFSIWVDAKLELRVDPYKLLERFLWRGNFTWAISRHYARFDIFVEAERNKAAGKYSNASIDEQTDTYRREGMTPYSADKLPIISDVPEGCVIIRELVPLTNLLACLWFNEVERFTSRDQISFGFCRDKVRAGVPGWNTNMFLDCERRNFVVQKYHKDVLAKKLGNAIQGGAPPK